MTIVIKDRKVKYEVTVNQTANGKYEVEDAKYILDFAPSYQEYTNVDETLVRSLDTMVRDQIDRKIPSGYKLTRIEKDEPFYRFHYTSGESEFVVELTFDPILRKITIVNVRVKEVVVQPVVTVV